MIVADTNVLSEPLRREPSPRVLAWLDSTGSQIAITSLSVAELLYGAARLPEGRRRTDLTLAIERILASAGDRVLGFDAAAARAYASLRESRERAGRPASVEDLMIASICLAHDLAIATRNVGDFDGFGVQVVNPWETGDAL